MNLPNKLTVLRVLMIPVFVVLFNLGIYASAHSVYFTWAFIVFVAASLTDMLDGYLARKHNLVTDFGKLMDPLADKLLVMAAMVCISSAGGNWLPGWMVIVILSREFLVSAIRQIAAGKGVVIAADVWGKAKTIAQMIWLSLVLCFWDPGPAIMVLLNFSGGFRSAYDVTAIIIYHAKWLVLALTVISGVNYCWKNRELFRDM